MGFLDKLKDVAATLRRLASHWRLLAALALAVAVGAVYLERKLFPTPSAPPAVTMAKAPASGQAPASPGARDNEPQTGAPAETPGENASSQMVDVAARPVAILRGEGSWSGGLKTLSEAIAKVNAAMTQAGLAAAGRPFAAFTETNDAGFHYEAMIPVAKAPDGANVIGDGVEIGASPAGKALKFEYRGRYDDIDSTYEAITAYLDEKGLDTKNVFIEEYLTDLKSGDDDGLEVDVYVFVK